MISNCLTEPCDKQPIQNIITESFTRFEAEEAFYQQVKMSFLQQSARYLGLDSDQHELLVRSVQDPFNTEVLSN